MKSELARTIWTKQLEQPFWYIARSNRAQEGLAQMSLDAAGFETYFPLLPKINKRGENIGAALFPSFVFVRLCLGANGWTRVFSARGVQSILGNGTRPSPLADVDIHRIRLREHDGFVEMKLTAEEALEPVAKPQFKAGQRVRVAVNRHVFGVDALDAVFTKAVGKDRCDLLIQFLGDSPRLARVSLAQVS